MTGQWHRAEGGVYVEALVAVAILAIALVPIIGSYAVTPAAQRQAAGYVAAMNIARGRLEELHSLPPTGPDSWESLVSGTTTVQRDQQTYTVITTVDPPRTPNLKDVRVTVRWTDPRGITAEITLGTSVARRP